MWAKDSIKKSTKKNEETEPQKQQRYRKREKMRGGDIQKHSSRFGAFIQKIKKQVLL